MNKPTVLVILDGFGFRQPAPDNAITSAHTPHLDYFFAHFPHAILQASGTAVGLPPGYIGNSEVGHQTIGAGRVIPQDIVRIFNAIKDGNLIKNPIITTDFTALKKSGKALHLAGLISDAGVHSHIEHLYALLDIAKMYGIQKVYIHAFLDGRDVPPESAAHYLHALEDHCKKIGVGKIATIIGRFYAMDRDENWDRTQQAYDIMTTENQSIYTSWQQVLKISYEKNITDEYIPPIQLDARGILKDGDGLIFFNFRPDRIRQLSACFTEPHFNAFATKKIALAFCITMTDYDDAESTAQVLFKKHPVQNSLKEVLSQHGITMFSIAETEKYAHVTYFFGGGIEKPFPGETRIIIPSLHTKNYVDHPCMSAPEITAAVIKSLTSLPKDFYLINYANADMVGHSGNFDATVKAIECLDTQLKELYDVVITKLHGTIYITADHGKAEQMYDEKAHQPRTAHNTAPVPFIMIENKLNGQTYQLPLTGLADIAPFILKNMNIPVPAEMEEPQR